MRPPLRTREACQQTGEAPLERAPDSKAGGDTPEDEVEGGKDSRRAGGATHGAAAEDEVVEKDGQGDEAGEVEDDVGDLESEDGPGVEVCCVVVLVFSGLRPVGRGGRQRCLHFGRSLGVASR